MYGAAISGHFLILCMCVLSWFVFVPPKTAQDHTKKNIPQRIKNAGHHLSYRFQIESHYLRGKNSMEWWDFKLLQRWLLQHQSAPRADQ